LSAKHSDKTKKACHLFRAEGGDSFLRGGFASVAERWFLSLSKGAEATTSSGRFVWAFIEHSPAESIIPWPEIIFLNLES